MVLVCEYGIIVDDQPLAFLLLGCSYRIIRILGLDDPNRYLDSKTLAETTQGESERRLVWSCFILDSLVASGVESNSGWRHYPKIPLPAPDHAFISQSLKSAASMPTIDTFIKTTHTATDPSIRAHMIYVVVLKSRALQ
jgi:hypothetical protein